MTPPTDRQLDLQAAADELGVHYQTAYRWVRNGRLEAELVGGRYLVSRDDISQLIRAARPRKRRRRHEPVGSSMQPSACTRRSSPATRPPPSRSPNA